MYKIVKMADRAFSCMYVFCTNHSVRSAQSVYMIRVKQRCQFRFSKNSHFKYIIERENVITESYLNLNFVLHSSVASLRSEREGVLIPIELLEVRAKRSFYLNYSI